MQGKLRLIYFNAKGHAELSRWILAYGGIPYIDDRVDKLDWPRSKQYIFTGRLPTLVAHGRQLPQSFAISRYLACKANLLPQDTFAAASCDALITRLNDLMEAVYKIMWADLSDGEKKKAYDKLYTNEVKGSLARINGLLGEHDWLVSEKVTWGDLGMAEVANRMPELIKRPEMLNDYPNIQSHSDRVLALPGIKEWNEKQPQLPY